MIIVVNESYTLKPSPPSVLVVVNNILERTKVWVECGLEKVGKGLHFWMTSGGDGVQLDERVDWRGCSKANDGTTQRSEKYVTSKAMVN